MRDASEVTAFGRDLSDELLTFVTTALVANNNTRLMFEHQLPPGLARPLTWGPGQIDAYNRLSVSASSLYDAFDKLASDVPPH